MQSSGKGDMVPVILRNDFKRLMRDIENMEKDMGTLKCGYSARSKDIQNIDFGDIIRHARELEWNFNMAIADFAIACKQYWKEYNFPVAEALRTSLVYMDCISNDLEDVKKGIYKGKIRFALFKELCVDWEEFKKSIYHTRRLANQYQKRRKNFHWLTENGAKVKSRMRRYADAMELQ
jgi:hypothetical protein